MHLFTSLATVALAATSVIAAPAKRDSCTFTNAADAIKNKKSCSTITLNNIAVPAGTTLDLTNLQKGTNVVFKGTTTFGYKEWKGPLVSISGEAVYKDQAGGGSGASASSCYITLCVPSRRRLAKTTRQF